MHGVGTINTLEDLLQHHGTKGMKWGVRKSKSANQTKAESEVVSRKNEFKKAKQKFNKESMYGTKVTSTSTRNNLNSGRRELGYAKQDLSKVKILEKLNAKPKSSQQLAKEAKYKADGYSADEAAVEAYKNIRVNKALIAGATVAITAGAAYAGYKISDEYMDKIIKSGSSLQNVSSDSDVGVRDAFYSSKNALDKMKYQGLFGNHIQNRGNKAFSKEIKTLTDIKRASPKNAQKVLQELINKDPEFAKGFKSEMSATVLGATYKNKVLKNADKIASGKVNKSVYEVFNASLVVHSPSMQKLTDKYYDSLSKKGYNAIKDTNDSKYSSYGALNPIIAFGTKGKVSVINVRELAKSEVAKKYKISMTLISAGPIVKQGVLAAAPLLATTATAKVLTKSIRDKRVTSYLKENPNSKMTRTEIQRMIERS